MMKRDYMKEAIAHRSPARVPFMIHLTGDAMGLYGDRLLDEYQNSDAIKAMREGRISKAQAVNLSIGNYGIGVSGPWWDWYEVPACYQEPDAPEILPKTRGTGSYSDFEKQVQFLRDNFYCYITAFYYGSHFEKANFARGIENFLADLAGEPEFAEQILSAIIRKNMVMLENMVYHPEIDGVLLGSDWGSQQSLLMSPAIWRDMIKPGEQKEYDLIHGAGRDVWVHSCGNIEQILPELVQMGVNVLNPVQPECMDIVALKRKFGESLTFWGGISTQQTLPYGSPEEVKKETQAVIETMGQNGGYITAPAQEIQGDVPYENLKALIDTARYYG